MKQIIFGLIGISAIGCASAQNRNIAELGAPGRIITYTSPAGGFNTHTFFFEGKNEVVAFDAQFTPALAEESIKELRRYTNKPVKYVVVTHPNPDKFNGLPAFQALGAKAVASAQTVKNIPAVHEYKKNYFVIAKMFTEANYPKLPKIDEIFAAERVLVLGGGEKIFLTELSRPGVSTNQTIIFIPSVDALIVGDLVHAGAHAWLEGGIVNGLARPTISDWIKDLEDLNKSFPQAIVYGGRGESGPSAKLFSQQIRYLNSANQIVSDYAQEIKSKNQNPDYPNLQKRFESAFPQYDLGYMILYGSYGLLNSKLK